MDQPPSTKLQTNFIESLISELQPQKGQTKQSDGLSYSSECSNFFKNEEMDSKRKSEVSFDQLLNEQKVKSKKQIKMDSVEQSNLAKVEEYRKISRKTSDDIIKMIEQLPENQISDLLTKIQTMNSPGLPLRLDMNKLIQVDDFNLNEKDQQDQQSRENKKQRKKRESKEKECKCCGQLVKRHQCLHKKCSKPCPIQEKFAKKKEIKPEENGFKEV